MPSNTESGGGAEKHLILRLDMRKLTMIDNVTYAPCHAKNVSMYCPTVARMNPIFRAQSMRVRSKK